MKFNDSIQAIQEGIWDRAKARTAGVGGAISGVGKRIAGSVKGAVAGARGDIAGAQAAAQQGKEGAIAGPIAKINSYKKTAQSKIKKVTDEILNDISKLGININANPNIANGLVGSFNKGFDTLINQLQNPSPAPGAAAPAGAAPTPVSPARRVRPRTRPASAAPTPASPSSPAPASPASAPTPAASSAPTPPATSSTPASPTPATPASPAAAPAMDDKSIVDDLTKNKDAILADDGLIGKAKFVAGKAGLGTTGKAGVELMRKGPSGDVGVEQAKAELAKKYNVAPEKLVELLGQVFTESKKHKKHISFFQDLYKKI